jgi:hypothetical protein
MRDHPVKMRMMRYAVLAKNRKALTVNDDEHSRKTSESSRRTEGDEREDDEHVCVSSSLASHMAERTHRS